MTNAPVIVDRAALATLGAESRARILSLQDVGGAYPASPTFSAYRGYAWFRDGAFVADGMSAAGEVESASAFFDWCARTIESCAPRIGRIAAAAASGTPVSDDEMLPTRFTLDGVDGTAGEWWDFQLDGYGLWVWALSEHVTRHGLDPARWVPAVELTVDYLASSWGRPCYDWWEEHVDQVHGSTLGSIAAGLRGVAELVGVDPARTLVAARTAQDVRAYLLSAGVRDGHLVKWIGSQRVDASLAAVVGVLGVVDAAGPVGLATIAEIDAQLAVAGGVHRFAGDTFYGGGQWPLLSCLLGLAHAASGDRDRALELLRWAAGTARAGGTMPEQVADHLLDPSRVDEWVRRWGTSADPLLWSHGMFLRLAAELGVLE